MHHPTIHINGTGAAELERQAREAVVALRAALEALQGAEPHARDYYPQGEEAIFAARREHRALMASVEAARSAMEARWEHIADAAH